MLLFNHGVITKCFLNWYFSSGFTNKMIQLWSVAYVKWLTWTVFLLVCRWSARGAATERPLELTQYSLCSPCHMIARQGSSGAERAHLLILTASASVVEPREAVIQHRLVNRFNGPLSVTGPNTINAWACVCCTAAIVCVSAKRQNEFRGIIILKLDRLRLPGEMSKMEWDDLI